MKAMEYSNRCQYALDLADTAATGLHPQCNTISPVGIPKSLKCTNGPRSGQTVVRCRRCRRCRRTRHASNNRAAVRTLGLRRSTLGGLLDGAWTALGRRWRCLDSGRWTVDGAALPVARWHCDYDELMLCSLDGALCALSMLIVTLDLDVSATFRNFP
jgi:hypothetical protein